MRPLVMLKKQWYEVTEYPHPAHKNLVLCDLPGVGTTKFPKKTYLQEVKVDTYDFFIIITATRFTENDTWLATEVSKRNKSFYFVKTKIEQDVITATTHRQKSVDETVEKIRADTQNKIQALNYCLPQCSSSITTTPENMISENS